MDTYLLPLNLTCENRSASFIVSMSVSERIPATDLYSPMRWANQSSIYFDPSRYSKFTAELARPVTAPEWTTPNKVELVRDNVILRNFSNENSRSDFPLLILPPQSGHHSCIVDFDQDQSLVEAALKAKASVYACEWPAATYQRRHETIDDFIKSTDACVEAIAKNGKGVTLVGLCQGGWQAAIYTALYPEKVNHLILAGAPIDFHAGHGKIQTFVERFSPMPYFNATVAWNPWSPGNMPGELMLQGFKWMNPVERFVKEYEDLFEKIDNKDYLERRHKFNNWYEWPQHIPGKFFLQTAEKLFQKNLLIKRELEILGQQVELSRIACPTTMLAGEKDDITLPEQLFNAIPYIGTDDDQIEMFTVPESGHIGVIMSHRAIREYWSPIFDRAARISNGQMAA